MMFTLRVMLTPYDGGPVVGESARRKLTLWVLPTVRLFRKYEFVEIGRRISEPLSMERTQCVTASGLGAGKVIVSEAVAVRRSIPVGADGMLRTALVAVEVE
jgi:hypothetical protein